MTLRAVLFDWGGTLSVPRRPSTSWRCGAPPPGCWRPTTPSRSPASLLAAEDPLVAGGHRAR